MEMALLFRLRWIETDQIASWCVRFSVLISLFYLFIHLVFRFGVIKRDFGATVLLIIDLDLD